MTELIALQLWIRLLLIQVLLLLITITIESWIFRRKQKWSQRISVQYGTLNNLFTTALGWLVFFSIEPFLKNRIQTFLIRLILFEKNFQEPILINHILFVMFYLVIFLFNAVTKRIGIELILALLSPPEAVESRPLAAAPIKMYQSYKQQQKNRQQGNDNLNSMSGTIIVATFLSQLTACLILLLLVNYLRIKRWMQG